MTINWMTFKGLWARLGERTKLIGVAVLAFILGTLWGGRNSAETGNGRYVPWGSTGSDGPALLDTRTGEIWVLDGSTHRFKRWATLPYW